MKKGARVGRPQNQTAAFGRSTMQFGVLCLLGPDVAPADSRNDLAAEHGARAALVAGFALIQNAIRALLTGCVFWEFCFVDLGAIQFEA